MCAGIGDELCGIQLADERRNQRSHQILEALAANPEASINAVCDGWSDSMFRKRLTQSGGDNNRAKDAPVGPRPIRIGRRRMNDFATAWLAFGPQT